MKEEEEELMGDDDIRGKEPWDKNSHGCMETL
jgi:hypothetical protein